MSFACGGSKKVYQNCKSKSSEELVHPPYTHRIKGVTEVVVKRTILVLCASRGELLENRDKGGIICAVMAIWEQSGTLLWSGMFDMHNPPETQLTPRLVNILKAFDTRDEARAFDVDLSIQLCASLTDCGDCEVACSDA